MYTIWWDHRANVSADVTLSNVTADDLANVLVSGLSDAAEAVKVALAYADELANLGHPVLVAVSN